MSEGQNSTATLTQTREPTTQDVEILHRIILRAQDEPYSTDRDSLITAYESVFKEQGLNPSQDEVCLYVLLEILNSGVEGATLVAKFEQVLRNRGIEVLFDEDDTSTRGTVPIVATNSSPDRQEPVQAMSSSASSEISSKDVTDLALNENHRPLDLDPNLGADADYISQLEEIADRHNVRVYFTTFRDHIRDPESRFPDGLPRMNAQADGIYDGKLKFKTFTHWRAEQRDIVDKCARAENFYSRHKRTSRLHQLLDSARVQRIRAMEEERLRGWGLYHITVASRKVAFLRQTDARLRTKYLRIIINSARALSLRNAELTDREWRFQSRFDIRRMRSKMEAMAHSHQQLDHLNASADSQYSYVIGERAIQKWYPKAHHVRGLEIVADDQRFRFLKHNFFSLMLDSAQAQNFRRRVLEMRYFRKWVKLTRAQKLARFEVLKELSRAAARKRNMAIAARCLQKWRDTYLGAGQLQHRADEVYTTNSNKVAHRILVTWYKKAHDEKYNEEKAAKLNNDQCAKKGMLLLTGKCYQLRQMQQKADDYVSQLHRQRVMANHLKLMRGKAFEVHRREQDAEYHEARLTRQRDRRMLKRNFDQLRRQLAAQGNEGPLILPPATPAERRAEQLNRLISTTPPTIPFAARLRGDIRPSIVIEDDELESR